MQSKEKGAGQSGELSGMFSWAGGTYSWNAGYLGESALQLRGYSEVFTAPSKSDKLT